MSRASLTAAGRLPRNKALAFVTAALGVVVPLLVATNASAQTAACRSMDPAAWPRGSKPYFMVALDTSGSMDGDVTGAAPSCSGYPSTRLGHARCALANMVKAYSGQVNLGLATFPVQITKVVPGSAPATCTNGVKDGTEKDVDCGGSCTSCDPGKACTANTDCSSRVCTGGFCQALTCPTHITNDFAGCDIRNVWTGSCTSTCGNYTGGLACAFGGAQTGANQRSANVLVPLPQDDYWNAPPTVGPNANALLSWVDNQCGDCKELFSDGNTPLNGTLRDMYRYLSSQWRAPGGADANQAPAGSPTFATPLTGTERSCRAVNVILITDGDETCPDDGNAAQAQAAATQLRNGWTIGSTTWRANTYVVDVSGGAAATGSNNIAAAGGTTAAYTGQNEVALAQALSDIIAASIKPETCDNSDNNCNGCIDEGSKLYCNQNKAPQTLAFLQNAANNPDLSMCCSSARATCLTAYTASISAANPKGSRYLLPCWEADTEIDFNSVPQKWLCVDPGERCDDQDNNCDAQVYANQTASFATNVVDEQQNKCGSPLHCPAAETCNGQDDNCDLIIDNQSTPLSTTPGSACPATCPFVTSETCNGCDDDCDGVIDDGVANQPCGFSPPAACAGVRTCTPVPGVPPGSCLPGVTQPGTNRYGTCSSTPPPTDTTCDNVDDNCNGVLDEGAAPTACTNGQPGLVYKDVFAKSQCVKGQQACHTTTCVGWIGPSTEICDGIDNDCDGSIDENLGGAVGNSCGSAVGECTAGTTACVGGVIVCNAAKSPQPEVCNGKDDNCNGQTDEAPLNDGPTAPGCWRTAGATCSLVGAINTVTWNAPAGATCSTVGTLTTPCQTGALVCGGVAGWSCQGGQGPSPEICNGIDNDCDSQADSTDPSLTGVGGVCAPPGTVLGSACQGTTTCSAGKLSCGGGATPTPEICDGKDNDCDGLVDGADSDLQGVGGVCGSNNGVCKAGILACVNGAPVCQGEVKPGTEVCDGLDNDCDGAVDDSVADVPVALGCWNLPGAQCSGGGRTWNAPAGGTCTGVGTLTAPCSAGTLVCAGLNKWVCQGGTLPGTEVCDGVDNNCNGTSDDGNPGGGGACGTAPNVGPCKKGTLTCSAGQLSCVGEVSPGTELCDGVDNDCDGTPDNNVTAGVGNSCGSSAGICKKGVTACVAGAIKCSGGVLAGTETCNGLDDDCDGTVDNNLSDAPAQGANGCWQSPGTTCSFRNVQWSAPPGATCGTIGTLTTPCTTGALTCGGTSGWFCQGGLPPSSEICDNKDNDCDGASDEGNPGGGVSCGSDIGACKPGVLTCTNGALTCGGGTPPSPEICDNVDNNCDGATDEPGNLVGLGQICGSNVGTCKAGVRVCDATTHQPVCQGEIKPQPETCDGKDNDCNGSIDDRPTDTPSDPGCWQVPGSSCSFGSVTWDFPTGASCTKAGSLSAPCTAGALICKNGGWECAGGRVPEAAEVCDGVDNDCNPATQDGDPSVGTPCGKSSKGECRLGNIACTNGSLSCVGEVPPKPEICDGKDNDCDDATDENAPGSGVPCTGQCSTGLTACLAGGLVCQTTKQPTPEVCNGKDDDCDGLVDNGTLADAPQSGEDGCWNLPGTDCSYGTAPGPVTRWNAPPGGDCTGLGTLTSPCQSGRLRCDGIKGWSCIGGTVPANEICDGKDQDCDGAIDDGDPGGGASCGINVGLCTFGLQHCVNGTLTCDGKGKAPEACDGKDNDCDGTIDNGLPLGESCMPLFDDALFPGDRSQGLCRPGKLECDTTGTGSFVCKGGVGPVAEICDGLDNDCDGKVDEAGASPDGINGTTDPRDTATPPRKIGDLCGSTVGQCEQGTLGCVGGLVQCRNAVGPRPETCDCLDNDCNGVVDDSPAAGSDAPAVCGADTACVKTANSCQCATECAGGEFPCPTGFSCITGTQSSDSTKIGQYCVIDSCGDCSTQTVKTNGVVECGPAGTTDVNGKALPSCQCVAGTACRGVCATTTCDAGYTCVPSGDFAGRCQPTTDCRFFGCPAGKACSEGACVTNPCDAQPAPCAATEVCKPSPSFDRARCVPSCADVTCPANESCEDGVCKASACAAVCAVGEACLTGAGDAGSVCAPDPCLPKGGVPACSDGSYCEPTSGRCINDPCAGVKCPGNEICRAGECYDAPVQPGTGGNGGGGAGGSGVGATGGGLGSDASAGGTGAGGTGAGAAPGSGATTGAGGSGALASNEVVGLATGGGGCRCDLPSRGSSGRDALGLAGVLVAAFAARRRHSKGTAATRRGAVREGGAR